MRSTWRMNSTMSLILASLSVTRMWLVPSMWETEPTSDLNLSSDLTTSVTSAYVISKTCVVCLSGTLGISSCVRTRMMFSPTT